VWLPILLALAFVSLVGFVVVRRVRRTTTAQVVLGNRRHVRFVSAVPVATRPRQERSSAMLSKVRGLGRRGSTLLVVLLISALAAACGGASSGAAGPGAYAPGASAAPAAPAEGEGQGAGDGSGRDVAYLSGQPDLLIIKNGSLVLQVTDIDAGLVAATDRIKALGGYVSGSQRSGDKDFDQATLTFRVPAARWDDALAGLRGIATKVLGEDSTTEDVTTQVVDLAARIKNLRATEEALQGIMARAVEIKDVLAVQAELTTVRGQIEQMTAEKTNLEGRAAFSTLTVTFSLKPDPVLTSSLQFDPKSQVDQAAASLVSILQGLATAGIWFAIVWLPILLAVAIIVAIGLFIARRVRRTTVPPPAPPAESTA
jgi:hypothetical protein